MNHHLHKTTMSVHKKQSKEEKYLSRIPDFDKMKNNLITCDVASLTIKMKAGTSHSWLLNFSTFTKDGAFVVVYYN